MSLHFSVTHLLSRSGPTGLSETSGMRGLEIAYGMSRTAPQLSEVCEIFDLGQPLGPWRTVVGGLSNEIRRLDTTRGTFAVKRMVAGSHRPEFQGNVEASFRIELAAVRAGVPAPRPISPVGSQGCLAPIAVDDGSNGWVRVHEWVEADAVQVVTEQLAQHLGACVATTHGLTVPSLGEPVSPWQPDPELWAALAERARGSTGDWPAALADLVPIVDKLERRMRTGESGRPAPGHRDADAKNVLVRPGGGILLLDWDAAGPVDPDQELTSLLLDWAGEGAPEVARGILDGYASVADRKPELDPTQWVSGQLGWLAYNVERALGDHGAKAVELGEREIEQSKGRLSSISGRLDALLVAWRGL